MTFLELLSALPDYQFIEIYNMVYKPSERVDKQLQMPNTYRSLLDEKILLTDVRYVEAIDFEHIRVTLDMYP